MKDAIITSLSALYDLGITSYKPSKVYIEMPFGTNISFYEKKYNISVQNKETINIGTIEFKNNKYYCIERLFVELEKFPLENTIFNQAIKNLESKVNPALVLNIYKKINKKRRGINKERIEKFLSKYFIDIEAALKSKENNDKELVVREYIMALLSKKEVPISITKGGSAIELYLDFKRSTNDIDTHADISYIKEILDHLKNKNNVIYFDVINEEQIQENILKKKNNISLQLKVRTIKRNDELIAIINNINSVKLTLNGTYSQNELNEIINEFKITKTQLKTINNAHALVFTKEMLVAEKYQSLISKNKDSTRTKDLIDLYFLLNNNNDFNYEKFYKWFFRKWLNSSRDSKNQNEVIEFIKNHKDIELAKIKQNFSSALLMYSINVDYNDAIKIYNDLSNTIINRFK